MILRTTLLICTSTFLIACGSSSLGSGDNSVGNGDGGSSVSGDTGGTDGTGDTSSGGSGTDDTGSIDNTSGGSAGSDAGECAHELSSNVPHLVTSSELEEGIFCDSVDICFETAEGAEAASAVHPDIDCDAPRPSCSGTNCVQRQVHAIDEAKLKAFCDAFDAAEGIEQVTCSIFL